MSSKGGQYIDIQLLKGIVFIPFVIFFFFVFIEYLITECTKVQNPRYKDVTLKAYTSA